MGQLAWYWSLQLALLVLCCWCPTCLGVMEEKYRDGEINVCTSHNPPLVYCKDLEPEDYSGYEIELFIKVADSLGWDQSKLNWTCTGWVDMVMDLASGNGTCDIAVAGMTVRQVYTDMGLTFSWPTLEGGWSIMISAEEDSQSYFAFMNAFSWDLWLAIIVTMLCVGFVIWAVERWSILGKYKPGKGDPPQSTLRRHVWRSLGRPMQTEDMYSPSFAGSLIIVVFSFMMLILVAIYTGNTAAALTTNQLKTPIRAVSDLPGKAVGTYEGYVDKLKQRNINALGFPLNNADEDVPKMFQAIRNKEVSAIVLDTVILDFYAATECDLVVVGSEFQEYFQAVTFPKIFTDDHFLDEYNLAMMTLRETGQLEQLIDHYITPPEASCKKTTAQQDTTKVTFKQVSGLWLLLGASVAVACLLAFANNMMMRGAKKLMRTEKFQNMTVKMASTVRSVNSTVRSMTMAPKKRKSWKQQQSSAGTLDSMQSMPSGLQNMPSGLQSVPSGLQGMPSILQSMQTGGSLPSITETPEVSTTNYPPPLTMEDANGRAPGSLAPFRSQSAPFPGGRNSYPLPINSVSDSPMPAATREDIESVMQGYLKQIEQLVLQGRGPGSSSSSGDNGVGPVAV